MLQRLRAALSPSMVVALLALFLSLGGVGIAATGGNFILGNKNTATTPTELSASGASSTSALKLINTNTTTGSTALDLNVPAGKAPMKVNSKTKVSNLNADLLDGYENTAFLRRGVATNINVNPANGAAGVDVTNTGPGNGVQGKTNDFGGAGVYGEHNGPGGYGVAGRAGDGGHAIYGDNTGSGFAGYFEDNVHIGGILALNGEISCHGCVGAPDIAGKVNDADKLDGIDSAGFIQGGGSADGQAVALAPNTNQFIGPAFGGLVRLSYSCPSNVGGNGTLKISNASSGNANLFVDSGGANPDYFALGAGGFVNYPAAAGGESFFIQMQGSPGVALVSAATVHRPASNDCHTQAFGSVAG